MTRQTDAAFMSCGNNQHQDHADGLAQDFICTLPASSPKQTSSKYISFFAKYHHKPKSSATVQSKY